MWASKMLIHDTATTAAFFSARCCLHKILIWFLAVASEMVPKHLKVRKYRRNFLCCSITQKKFPNFCPNIRQIPFVLGKNNWDVSTCIFLHKDNIFIKDLKITLWCIVAVEGQPITAKEVLARLKKPHTYHQIALKRSQASGPKMKVFQLQERK